MTKTFRATASRGVLLLAGLTLSTAVAGCGLVGGAKQSGFCAQLSQAYPALKTEPAKALGPNSQTSDWKAYFDLTHQRLARLIGAAPAELSAPLTSLQTANDRLAAVYADAGYDARQIDAGLVTQLLSDSGHGPALDAVSRYAKSTCGIER